MFLDIVLTHKKYFIETYNNVFSGVEILNEDSNQDEVGVSCNN